MTSSDNGGSQASHAGTRNKSPTRNLTLPTELWADIVARTTFVEGAFPEEYDILHLPRNFDLRERIARSMYTRRSLCSVSKAFNALAEPFLYEILHFTQPEQLTSLINLVRQSIRFQSIISRRTRRIEVSCSGKRDDLLAHFTEEILVICRNLQHHSMDFHWLRKGRIMSILDGGYPGYGSVMLDTVHLDFRAEHAPHSSSLRSLTFKGIIVPSMRFSNLHTLQGPVYHIRDPESMELPALRCVILEDEAFVPPWSAATETFFRSHGSQLTSLVVRRCEAKRGMPASLIFRCVSESCPNLEDLVMDIRCLLYESDWTDADNQNIPVGRLGLLCRGNHPEDTHYECLLKFVSGWSPCNVLFPNLKAVRLVSHHLRRSLSSKYPWTAHRWVRRLESKGIRLEDENGEILQWARKWGSE